MQKRFAWMLILSIVVSPAMSVAGSQPGTPVPGKTSLKNVELDVDGSLRGKLVTEAGIPVTAAAIRVQSQTDTNKVSQILATDETGSFVVSGLKSGTCLITVGDNTYACRVWNHATAPPKSLQTVALVDAGRVVRGNDCCNDCCDNGCGIGNKIRCMSSGQKIGLGLLVGAAIAIPIALDDDDAS